MFFIFFCFFSLNCWILHPVATFPEKETVWLSDRRKDRKCKNMAEGILAYIMKTVKSWRTKDPQHSFHLSSSLNVLMELQQLHPHISSSSVTWWGIHSARYLCTLSPYQPKPLRPPSDRRTSPLVLNIWFPAVAPIHWLVLVGQFVSPLTFPILDCGLVFVPFLKMTIQHSHPLYAVIRSESALNLFDSFNSFCLFSC